MASSNKLKQHTINLIPPKLITSADPTNVGENYSELTNMRYKDNSPPVGIDGMTKINTTQITDSPRIKSAIQFMKSQPEESHIIVQAWNSGESASELKINSTAIPNQGDFSDVRSDDSNASTGAFAIAPIESLIYCNGTETLIWSGNEARSGAIYNIDILSNSFKYDFTDPLSNNQTDSNNIATLTSVTETDPSSDTDTKLLLHFENNKTDSGSTGHTVTLGSGTNNYSSSVYVFGAYSFYFNGSTHLAIADHADFNFSGGNWTIDTRLRIESGSGLTSMGVYSQKTDTNNFMNCFIEKSGSLWRASLSIMDTGTNVVTLTTDYIMSEDTWYHVEWAEDGDDWYIFIDGILSAYVDDTDRAANYTDNVKLGILSNNSGRFQGYMDEYRVSKTTRHTESFTPMPNAYGANTYTTVRIGTLRPMDGMKVYIQTANATAGDLYGEVWNGTMWASLTNVTDGTASGGVPFAQTGTITWDTTVSTAKQKLIDRVLLYWYQFTITNCDDTTQLYYLTVDMPMQDITDIWSGKHSKCIGFEMYDNSATKFNDFSTAVINADYDSGNTLTYANISSMATKDYILIHAAERWQGIKVRFGGANVNTNKAVLSVQYWNGTAWTDVTDLNDGTASGKKSFNKTGLITWTAPAEINEHVKDREVKRIRSAQNWLEGAPTGDKETDIKVRSRKTAWRYKYKLSFSQALSGSVHIDKVKGIPAPITIKGFNYPLTASNRLLLLGENSDDTNIIRYTEEGTAQVFNGPDAGTIAIGGPEELKAGAALMTQVGSELMQAVIITKANETYAMYGSTPEQWADRIYILSSTVGCPAPLTMKVVNLGGDESKLATGLVAIWQGADNIYICDGRSIYPIGNDIKDLFEDGTVTASTIDESSAWVDAKYNEYHWVFKNSGTYQEWVLNLNTKRWYKISRGSGNELRTGIAVKDTDGNSYTYGFIDTGYMMRLENGSTMNGSDIDYSMSLGDLAFPDSIMLGHRVKAMKVAMVASSNASHNNNVALSLFADGASSASSTHNIDPYSANRILIDTVKVEPQNSPESTFSKLKLTFARNGTEDYTFKPLWVGVLYDSVREDKVEIP